MIPSKDFYASDLNSKQDYHSSKLPLGSSSLLDQIEQVCSGKWVTGGVRWVLIVVSLGVDGNQTSDLNKQTVLLCILHLKYFNKIVQHNLPEKVNTL